VPYRLVGQSFTRDFQRAESVTFDTTIYMLARDSETVFKERVKNKRFITDKIDEENM
jgi:hypothetical protein